MGKPIPKDFEQRWLEEAHRRRNRILSREDKPLPGEIVFDGIQKRIAAKGSNLP